MAFAIPTLPALIDRIKGDMNARMGNTNALIPRSLAFVLAHVLSGVTWGLYLYQQWIAQQVIPDRAEGVQLERWARLFGVTRAPAAKAAGIISVTAAAGSDLVDGTVLQRVDGTEYQVVGNYHWASSSPPPVAVTVRAMVAGGSAGFPWATDAALLLVSPPAGVVATCPLVAPGISGGLDIESDASLLDRLLQRLANPPQGGAASDYVAWARLVAGVDLVWPQAFADGVPLGQVRVLFTIIDANDDGSVLPAEPSRTAVQATITARTLVTAAVTTVVPTDHPVAIEMSASLLPGFSPEQATTNVRRELQAKFRARAELDFSADGWLVENSRLLDAIGRADGIDTFDLLDVDGGGPLADVVLASNAYPTIVDAGVTINEA